MVFFRLQIHAMLTIITYFTTVVQGTQYRAGLLRANVQSGKSGTYHCVIRRMLDQNLIDQAYIVCGSHETDLRSQCIADINELQLPHHRDKVKVIFRQDFNTTMKMNRTLIICDETHLVAEKDQTLSKFLTQKHGISLAGTTQYMIDNHIYLLSVDATPHAEEACMAYNESLPKFRVTLETEAPYYGPADYYHDGHIHSIYTLSTPENKTRLVEMLRNLPNKYVLVRLQGRNSQKAHMMECFRRANCNIVHYDSAHSDHNAQIMISRPEGDRRPILCLEEAPPRTTVVFVNGRLRCGKRVPQTHIGLVWESSKTSNTDTIIQSLLGRMCGYNVPAVKPLIFIPARLLNRHQRKVIQLSDFERYLHGAADRNPNGPLIAPQFASYILAGEVQQQPMRDNVTVTQCVPIRFMLDPAQIDNLATAPPRNQQNDIKGYCLTKLIEEEDDNYMLTMNPDLLPAQLREIKTFLRDATAESCNLRNYSGDSNAQYYPCQLTASAQHTTTKQHISDFPMLTFCVTYQDFIPPAAVAMHKRPGEVFATFYTKAQGMMSIIDKESRIPRHNGMTHFRVRITDKLAACPAVSGYGFSSRIREDSANFEHELNDIVRFSTTTTVVLGNKFIAVEKGKPIMLPRAVYGNNLERLVEIVERFRTRGIRVMYQVKKRRPVLAVVGQQLPDHMLSFIEWNIL